MIEESLDAYVVPFPNSRGPRQAVAVDQAVKPAGASVGRGPWLDMVAKEASRGIIPGSFVHLAAEFTDGHFNYSTGTQNRQCSATYLATKTGAGARTCERFFGAMRKAGLLRVIDAQAYPNQGGRTSAQYALTVA